MRRVRPMPLELPRSCLLDIRSTAPPPPMLHHHPTNHQILPSCYPHLRLASVTVWPSEPSQQEIRIARWRLSNSRFRSVFCRTEGCQHLPWVSFIFADSSRACPEISLTWQTCAKYRAGVFPCGWVTKQLPSSRKSGTRGFQFALQSVLCQTKLQRDVSHHISLLWLVIS